MNSDSRGVLYVQKVRGRKLRFMVGGVDRENAHKFIRWEGVSSKVCFVHVAADGKAFLINSEGIPMRYERAEQNIRDGKA